MADSSFIPVVCALIERHDGRVLAAQRPAGKHLAFKWEFPGGKVEPGETLDAALIREIREELGCVITNLRALPRSQHAYANGVVEMIPFVCALTNDSPPPVAHEHAALTWLRPDEFGTLDFAPADVPIIAAYLQERGSAGSAPNSPRG